MHRSTIRFSVAVLGLFVVACSRMQDQGADSPAAAAASPAITPAGETGGMSTPESVRYDAELDVYFVSNINGNPSQRDGNGFIARVHGDSLAVMTKLVEGGAKGATLNAPKGMAIVGDTLWVADIDVLRGFNRRTGAPVASIDMKGKGATFLNDVAAGPDGAVYITDTGIVFDSTGATTHPGTDKVFRVSGRTVSDLVSGPVLAGPNGITWDSKGNRWILAPFMSQDLQALSAGSTTPVKIATGPGSYDGVEVLSDGRILVSSWADSAVHVVRDSTFARLITGINAPADFGYDSKRNVIAVPRFMDGKVEYFRVPGG